MKKTVHTFDKYWQDWAKKVLKRMSWVDHVLLFTLSIGIAVGSFIVYFFTTSFRFILPPTTAINWFTLHHYPKQQDYFYFYLGFSYISLVSLLLWVLFVWLKIKK
jgi:hypothetical protein